VADTGNQRHDDAHRDVRVAGQFHRRSSRNRGCTSSVIVAGAGECGDRELTLGLGRQWG
jgi:hypothetical protein